MDNLGLNKNNYANQNNINNNNNKKDLKEKDLISQGSAKSMAKPRNLIDNESNEKKTINEIDLNDIMLDEAVKPVVNLKYLLNIFVENLLSAIFRNCNPSSISENDISLLIAFIFLFNFIIKSSLSFRYIIILKRIYQ